MKRLTLARIIVLGLAIVVLGLVTVVPPANAVSLFSVETQSNSLVLIDSETGKVNTIGTLGFDAVDTDLASFGDRLFILNTIYQNRVDIYEVNPTTGATLSSAQVAYENKPVLHAEGLTNLGKKLIIGFSANGGDPGSESIGELSLTGAITNAISTAGDFDGFGGDGVSQIFSTDAERTSGPTNLFNVDYTNGSLSPITNIPIASNDIVSDGKNLFLLDINSGKSEVRLIKTSITGEIKRNIPIEVGQEYLGLAIKPDRGLLGIIVEFLSWLLQALKF